MDTICIDAPKSGVETYFIAGDWHYNEMDRGTFHMLPDGLFNFYCYQNWGGKIVLPSGKTITGTP